MLDGWRYSGWCYTLCRIGFITCVCWNVGGGGTERIGKVVLMGRRLGRFASSSITNCKQKLNSKISLTVYLGNWAGCGGGAA